MKTIKFLALVQMLFCSLGQAQQTHEQLQLNNFQKKDIHALVELGQSGTPMNEQYKMLTVHVGNPGIYHTIIIGKTPAGDALFEVRLEEAPTADPNKPGPSSVELNGLQYAGMRKAWDFGISYDGELKSATESELISALDKKGNETRIHIKEGQLKSIDNQYVIDKWMEAKHFWLDQARTAKSRAALSSTFSKWLKTPAGKEYIESFMNSSKFSGAFEKSRESSTKSP